MPLELTPTETGYPQVLRCIHDPPKRLWIEGDVSVLNQDLLIAIVGTRKCTPYGAKVAYELARSLASMGVTIVSGLALGIDTQAHRGALGAQGKTIAVLGCGIDVPYPSENVELKRLIGKTGAVVSELPPGTEGAPWTFPRRNRIISGLCKGVVIVEAGLKSGSLITAELALQQGRDVFAIPGNIGSPYSQGTNRLIQQGAKLVSSAADVLEELNLTLPKLPVSPSPVFSKEEAVICRLLSGGPREMDDLTVDSGYPAEKISPLLVEMEIAGKIKSLPGSRFVLSER